MLSEIVAAIGGQPASELPLRSACGVSTDSRCTSAGELFFALEGERFDGHAFVGAALERGAVGAVVRRSRLEEIAQTLRVAQRAERGVLIGIDDPLAALGRLGAYHRMQLATTVIAVVGSNGKTTTKAMIDCVLSGKLRGRASARSFNNAVGVPLTLLAAEAADDYLVVEIGTNAPGEVAALAALARPDMAVITSLGEEHLEGLGNLAGVAAEECSILRRMGGDGFAAVNIDEPLAREHLGAFRGRVATFGTVDDADLRVSAVEWRPPTLRFRLNNRFAYELPLAGRHNALNAAGAVAIARRLGFEHDAIAERLRAFRAPPMRSEVVRRGDVTILNDAYNANPPSMLAAIEMLEQQPAAGRRIAVLGAMRELGSASRAAHQRIARRLRESTLDLVLLVGQAGEWMNGELDAGLFSRVQVEHCADLADCSRRLRELLRSGDVVLLKASRAIGIERVLDEGLLDQAVLEERGP